jgi:hypothetical protein
MAGINDVSPLPCESLRPVSSENQLFTAAKIRKSPRKCVFSREILKFPSPKPASRDSIGNWIGLTVIKRMLLAKGILGSQMV